MNFQRSVILFLAFFVIPLVGCGDDKPQLAKVHGKVTYKGKPLTSGSVLFVPAIPAKDGREFPASGEIKGPDGSYELTTFEPGDGAPVGQHKVAVIALDGGSQTVEAPTGYNSEPTKPTGPRQTSVKSVIHKRYSFAETTPLSKTVAPGDNTLDIEIED